MFVNCFVPGPDWGTSVPPDTLGYNPQMKIPSADTDWKTHQMPQDWLDTVGRQALASGLSSQKSFSLHR